MEEDEIYYVFLTIPLFLSEAVMLRAWLFGKQAFACLQSEGRCREHPACESQAEMQKGTENRDSFVQSKSSKKLKLSEIRNCLLDIYIVFNGKP